MNISPTDPTNGNNGEIYYNPIQKVFKQYSDGTWSMIEATPDVYMAMFKCSDYEINEDGSVDVMRGDIKIVGIWDSLPVEFRNIAGDFDCSRCGLRNMANMPSYVGGDFIAVSNKFTAADNIPKTCGRIVLNGNKFMLDLSKMPREVLSDLDISNCNLVNIEWISPKIGGNLYANNNEIRIIPDFLEVGGDADFSNNKIITETTGAKIGGKLWLDENPCTAENDNLKENAIWS